MSKVKHRNTLNERVTVRKFLEQHCEIYDVKLGRVVPFPIKTGIINGRHYSRWKIPNMSDKRAYLLFKEFTHENIECTEAIVTYVRKTTFGHMYREPKEIKPYYKNTNNSNSDVNSRNHRNLSESRKEKVPYDVALNEKIDELRNEMLIYFSKEHTKMHQNIMTVVKTHERIIELLNVEKKESKSNGLQQELPIE